MIYLFYSYKLRLLRDDLKILNSLSNAPKSLWCKNTKGFKYALCFRITPIFIKNKTNASQNPKLKIPNQFFNYNVVVGLVEFGTRATWV